MKPRICGWSVVPTRGSNIALYGRITNHPDPNVGKGDNLSLTSDLVSHSNGIATTKSGTEYELGHSNYQNEKLIPIAFKLLEVKND
jgi:hypothetical protein